MDSADIAYVQRLIGQPWERHGLHCWALVAQLQRDLFGRTVPMGPAAVPARRTRTQMLSQDERAYGWTESPRPVHGAVVRMARTGGNPADLEHAGVFLALDGGLVLHTDEPHGVVADTLLELRKRGWEPRFFVPTGDHHHVQEAESHADPVQRRSGSPRPPRRQRGRGAERHADADRR